MEMRRFPIGGRDNACFDATSATITEELMTNIAGEPLAIVGMGCRFPKGLESIESLWMALKNRVSGITSVPADRWTADRYYSSNPIAKGKAYIRRGGFLTHDITRFDAGFFGITPRDAENMDPQQRLLLEVVWEAFENSGMLLPSYSGRKVGVYVGGFMLDHMITQMSAANRSAINQNTAAGMMMTMLSNRISHTFDFKGPSLSIDTACSSSLVAFHYACQDLWRGDIELAVVGGSNVMLRPEYPMGMCKGGFLSRDGECKSFDERGDGYGRGEGAGVVLVQPLSAAIRDGNEILATVIATGTNQDGRTPGVSMPSGDAQQALIEDVCKKYKIDPASIDYVECHGTGTSIGDPTETRAIGAVYGKARREKKLGPVIVGSIKTTTGHMEAAAGVAGVIKATLTVLHRQATPLANFQSPNPAILCDDWNIKLSDELVTLGENENAIRVAVNSFGYGGSNAHAILESAPASLIQPSLDASNTQATFMNRRVPLLLPVSGRSEAAVLALAGQYAQLLENSEIEVDDVLYSAAFKRAHLTHRTIVKGNNRQELIDALKSVANKLDHENVVRGNQPFQGHRQPVFVFTGMGPQWWAMGQELYRESPLYRAVVDEADTLFQSISGFSALAEMLRNESTSQITRTEFAQPANLLIQIGILAVLKSSGIRPGAVVGHSVGELGSAYAAGVLNLHDVLSVCYHRSRLQATCKGTGAMLAVGLSQEQTLRCIASFTDRVSIAAVNGPANVTIAGDSDALSDLSTELTRADIFNRALEVEVPYHSPMMDPILEDLKQALAQVSPNLPTVPLYSTVTGARVEGLAYGATYWQQNVRQPVEFANAIQSLLSDGFNTFLEIGPHPVLTNAIRDCIKVVGKDCRQSFTLRRNQPEVQTLDRGIMSVYADGCDIDWNAICPSGKFMALPNYPWQREYLWVETERAMQDRIAPIIYPMLGIQEAPGVPAYRNDFDHEPLLYLRDHVVAGMPILPAAGYVESILELARIQHPDASGFAIRDLQIRSPMIITAERGLDCVTTYDPLGKSATIRSLENGRLGAGQTHVTAKLAGLSKVISGSRDLEKIKSITTQKHHTAEFYRNLDDIGLSYGRAFQTIRELNSSPSGDRVLARIEMVSKCAENLSQYCLHPTLLDACFQALMVMLGESDKTYLPTGFDELCVYSKSLPQAVWCFAERKSQSERNIVCDLALMDSEGNTLASLRSMRLTAAGKRERRDRFGDRIKRQILAYDWTYGETLTEPKRLGHWLVISDPNEFTQAVMNQMQQFGAMIVGAVGFGDEFVGDGQRFTVRPGSQQDAGTVLRQVGELDGVVFMNALKSSDERDPIGEQALLCTIAFVKALLNQSGPRQPRVYVVTQGSCLVNEHDRDIRPAQSAVNGFCRVAFNELDGFRFSSIDLPMHIDSTVTDNLALELLCDDEHDEVALRGSYRLHSELLDTPMLSDDRVVSMLLDDKHPVSVRALRPDVESVGTARIVVKRLSPVGPDDVRLRIETTAVPPDLLSNPVSEAIAQPLVEVVARVLEVGSNVCDLEPGMRVCGFAPADLASHMVGPRNSFQLVPLDEGVDASTVVSMLDLNVRAAFAIDMLGISPGHTALLSSSDLGVTCATLLAQRGVRVAMLCDDRDTLNASFVSELRTYSHCPEGVAAAVEIETKARGFDVLAVPLESWQAEFGFHMIGLGGMILDLDPVAGPAALPHGVTCVARTDYRVLLTRPESMMRALRTALDLVASGELKTPAYLEVSVSDLGWQKLPLADTSARLLLNYETNGSDLPVVQADDLEFCSNATYLVTGGFGGFGGATAEWLVANGAKHLVLTGRTGADTEDRKKLVRFLEAKGASVIPAACDTSDFEALKSLFEKIATEMPPLKGVFHSGAVILDQPISEIDEATFQNVMRSKALGAWNLHLITKHLQLDHFVLYSSVANLVGNSRQAAYSAANGFLNGLAHLRSSQQLPGTSVNWGAIADVGVVANDEKLEQFLRYTGLRGITSVEALDQLRIGLARRVSQFGVTMITSWADWARFETRGSTSSRFQTLIASDSEGKDSSTQNALIEELSKLDPTEQVELLATLMLDLVASVVKADPSSIPIDKGIDQLGVDSLMATEIQMLFDTQLGINVSILELIGEGTIRTLATQTLKKLDLQPQTAIAIGV